MKVMKKTFLIALMIWALWTLSSKAATGIITTEGVNIRREANTTSEVLTIAYEGETVEVLEEQDGWYKVRYGEYEGYIRSDLLQVENASVQGETVSEEEPQTEQVQEEQENPSNETDADETEQPEDVNIEVGTQATEETVEKEEFTIVDKRLKKNAIAKVIPNLSASGIAELTQGQVVTVVQEMNHWSCIQIDSKTAWVLTSALEELNAGEQTSQTETETPSESETEIMYISVTAAVLREGPDTSYDPVGEMARGEEVEILSEDGDWYQVRYGEQEGYVAKRLVTNTKEETHRGLITQRNDPEVLDSVQEEEEKEEAVEENQQTEIAEESTEAQEEVQSENTDAGKQPANHAPAVGEQVVTYAKQFLGYPYVYGGAGPSSFDCSGFTKYVYQHFGVYLSHSAVTQASNGTFVEKVNLQLGDLVIFRDWDNSSIGHCGIYIGDGNFIHAANSTRGVVTDTLNSGYYYERYVSGRRLF